jgi:hypothetical protein
MVSLRSMTSNRATGARPRDMAPLKTLGTLQTETETIFRDPPSVSQLAGPDRCGAGTLGQAKRKRLCHLYWPLRPA